MGKRLIALLCVALVLFAAPATAFAYLVEEGEDLVAREPDSSSFMDGTRKGFVLKINGGKTTHATVKGIILEAEKKTDTLEMGSDVLETAVYELAFADYDTKAPITYPQGAELSFDYKASSGTIQNIVDKSNVAEKNIRLDIYEMSGTSKALSLVGSASVNEWVPLEFTVAPGGTFPTLALAFVDITPKPDPAKPEENTKPESSSSSDSSSDINSGYIPYVHPTTTPLVATGKDDSASSPKTGQSVPADTAPLALLATAALGTTALIASRRRNPR